MIRTRTTFIVGAGAGSELQLPTDQELLTRIAMGLDFSRMGTELQTKDGLALAQYIAKLGSRLGKSDETLRQAAQRIRTAAKLAPSIEAVIDQHDSDPLISACAKLAIVHFVCQAEAKSTLRGVPRIAGDLPIQGTETWLFQLGQLVTSGVPRSRVEKCLDEFAIVSFAYDRSIEHFLPHAMEMAFGMPLKEAQQLVAAKLTVIHPYGSVGRLPWQTGDMPDAEWGSEQPWNIHNLAAKLRSTSEVQRDQAMIRTLRGVVSGAKRLVFLGFGFQPNYVDLLFDYSLSHDPDVMVSVQDMPPVVRTSVYRMLKRKTGIDRDDLIMLIEARSHEIMRDFSLLLES